MGNIAHICTLLWLDCHVMWELIIPLHAYFMLSSVARKIQNLCRSKPIVWRSKRWSCEVLCSDSLAKVVEVNQGQSRLQGCFVNTRQTETYFHAKWSMTSWKRYFWGASCPLSIHLTCNFIMALFISSCFQRMPVYHKVLKTNWAKKVSPLGRHISNSRSKCWNSRWHLPVTIKCEVKQRIFAK